jgi:hypothetical protein
MLESTERQCLTDAQAEHGCNCNNRTQRFRRTSDNPPHLIIRERPRLCFYSFSRQSQVCEAKISTGIIPRPRRFEKRE